jgi:hypothetical protein
MTAAELIALLSRYPALSSVKAYDADADDLRPITGAVYGSEVIELQTDPDEEEEEEEDGEEGD